MQVHFISEQKGNTVIQCPELGPKETIRIVRGKFNTSNKIKIKRLLSDDYARRNVTLAPGQDMQAISDYLEQENRPDVFTKEYLNEIPFDLWKEILEKTNVVNVQFPLVGVAKASLEGRPMDPVIEEIVERYNAGKPEEVAEPDVVTDESQDVAVDETEPAEEKPKVKINLSKKEKSEGNKDWTSDDFNVNEAKTYLAGKEYHQVEGFMSESENRISLIEYWNQRYPEHQVSVPE